MIFLEVVFAWAISGNTCCLNIPNDKLSNN